MESAKEVLFARNAEKVLSRERSHVVAIKISSRAIREFTEVKSTFLRKNVFQLNEEKTKEKNTPKRCIVGR